MILILLKKKTNKQAINYKNNLLRSGITDIGTYNIFTKFIRLPDCYISQFTEEISIKFDTDSPSH